MGWGEEFGAKVVSSNRFVWKTNRKASDIAFLVVFHPDCDELILTEGQDEKQFVREVCFDHPIYEHRWTGELTRTVATSWSAA
tara:strand:- start:2968 stop:3216 length:249 start_codon:yes stop_codon:yes gene_type:complete